MRDTLVSYTNGAVSQEFHGVIRNLTSSQKQLVFESTPASFPDTGRETSICVALNCDIPQSGPVSWNVQIAPQHEDSVRFTVYTYLKDWSGGPPIDSVIHGDYIADIAVYAPDNPTERTGYRLHLHDLNASAFKHSTAERELSILPAITSTR